MLSINFIVTSAPFIPIIMCKVVSRRLLLGHFPLALLTSAESNYASRHYITSHGLGGAANIVNVRIYT